jgi:antirestriction protein
MDTPRIYVACLAAYNSGYLHGIWCDATQGEDGIYKDIYDMLAKSPVDGAEEWAIHDYSGFGDARLDEYESIPNVVKLAEFIDEHGELGAALLGDYSIDDAQALLEDQYHGAYDSEVDFAQSIFEECFSDAIPKNLIYYIDHEAFSRDLFMSDYFSMEAQGRTHVFSHH